MLYRQGGFRADTYNTGTLIVKLFGGTYDPNGTAVIGEISIKDKNGKEYAPAGTKLSENALSYTQNNLPTNNPSYYTVSLNNVNANYTVDNNPTYDRYVFSDHAEYANFTVRKKCGVSECSSVTITVEDKTNPLIQPVSDAFSISKVINTTTGERKFYGYVNYGKGHYKITPSRYRYTFRDMPPGDYQAQAANGSLLYTYEMNPTVPNNTGPYQGHARDFTVTAGVNNNILFSISQKMDKDHPANLKVQLKGDIDAAGGGNVADVVITKPTGERIRTTIKESGDANALSVTKSLPSSSASFPLVTGYQVLLEKINPKYVVANLPGNTNPRLGVKVTTGKFNAQSFTIYKNISSNCTVNCGSMKVTALGTDHAKDRQVAEAVIIAPDGKELSLGGLIEGATDPSLTNTKLQPASNYQLLLRNINPELQLDPTVTGNVARRTGLTITANQTLSIDAVFMPKNDGICDRSTEKCGALARRMLGADTPANRAVADVYIVAPNGRKILAGTFGTGDHSIAQNIDLKLGRGYQMMVVPFDIGPAYPCFELDPTVTGNTNPRKWLTVEPYPDKPAPIVDFTFRQKKTCTGSSTSEQSAASSSDSEGQ